MQDKSKSPVLMKHTAAVHISNILSLNQRKIANILLRNAYYNLQNNECHTIQVKELLRQLGWKNSSNTTDALKYDLKALNTVQLEWNILKQDRKRTWSITTFLADAKIENGNITYSYSKALRDALYNPNIYAKLNLLVQKQLSIKHSMVLWEYVSCELSESGKNKITTSWLSIDELRKILGIQNSSTYAMYNALNQKVLMPAIDEINQKTDVHVYFEVQKEKRKVKYIRFIANKIVQEVQNESIKYQYSDAAEMLGIANDQIANDVEEYGAIRVENSLNYVKKQIASGKLIRNVAAFYKMAVRDNWGEVVSSESIKKRQLELEISESGEPDEFKKLRQTLRLKVGDAIFEAWFRDIKFKSLSSEELVIEAGSSFRRDYIITNFKDVIDSTARETLDVNNTKIV